jgi:hypothetical protein
MSANHEHAGQAHDENALAEANPEQEDDARRNAESGAELYGGDSDTDPSVTEQELQTGLERDQAEG